MNKQAQQAENKDSFLKTLALSSVPGGVGYVAAYPALGPTLRNKRVQVLDPKSYKPGDANRTGAIIEGLKVDGVPLREYLKRHGVSLHSATEFGKGQGPMYMDKSLSDKLQGLLGKNFAGDISNGYKGTVVLGFKPGASANHVIGTTAHEVGHAVRDIRGISNLGRYKRAKMLGMLLGGIGSYRTALSDTSDKENAAWIAGTALSQIPVLNEEFQASRLGSKLVGLKGLKRLRAFKGLPSYAVAASAPAIALGARKLYDGLTSKSAETKQAAPLGLFRQAGRFLGKQLPRVQQGLSRYGELLAGGNAQKMRPFEQFVGGIQRHFPQTSNTFGGRIQHAFDRFNTRLGASAFTAANGLGQMGDRIHPLVGNLGREAGQEMRSVIKARTATGAGLLGALGLTSAISGTSGNPAYQV